MTRRDRIETLIIARAHVTSAATSARELVAPLARFGPRDRAAAAWLGELEAVAAELQGVVLTGEYRLVRADELRRRIGPHRVTAWAQAADRVVPALALEIAPNDSKGLGKLASRDAWAAAIVARARDLWTGGPPSLAVVCDAIAWAGLGLSGKPKRLPAEVRSLFLQRELLGTAGAPAVLVRQLAARIVDVPRTDGRSLRDGLVRGWLAGHELRHREPLEFAERVLATARAVREGTFGERKVFISEVWRLLRAEPEFAALSLDEFKRRLVLEHKAGRLVLARADLVAAMSPQLVAASETRGDGADFHFIVRGNP